MASIALYAPTLLRVSPIRPAGHPLAGAELSLLHLRHALERLGHTVVCFTNLDGVSPDSSLRAVNDFREEDFEVVIYSRTYGHKLRSRKAGTRRLLWLHDTVEEASSLVAGGTSALGQALNQYHHLVFVSTWQRMRYAARFPDAVNGLAKATSIRHLLPELSLHRCAPSRFDVIHTAHPRKALAAVLGIYDILAAKRHSLRLALVDAAGIYQDVGFVYKGRQTSLSALLWARYGKAGPPFAVLAPMPQHELISLLAQCEILLHPDQSTETGATTVLEAIQAGCGTVVSDLGCLPEMASATGSVLPAPGAAALEVYADAVCVALERRAACVQHCDVGQNIRDHNSVQTSRWACALAAASGAAPRSRLSADPNYRDINGLLAAHPRQLSLALAVPGLRTGQLAVHLFPQRGMALMGLLEPTVLPAVDGDIDAQASALARAMNALLERLSAHGISRLVMRISCQPASSTTLAALLCAVATFGVRVTTIRQLFIALQMTQDDEQRERATLSPRVRQQVEAARKIWIIRRLSGDTTEFDAWFDAYEQHRSSFGAVGLVRERVRKLLDSDGELGVHGALAIDPASDAVCGFYLILRVGDFATLHSWGTDRRYRSNLHKLLIADAACLARQRKVKCFEYGSDLSEYGQHDGLNALYRRFAGAISPSLQLDLNVPGPVARYALI